MLKPAAQHRKRLDRLLADRDHAVRAVRDERAAYRKARQKAADAVRAQALVQEVAEATQKFAHAQIAGVVTRCLEAVFGDEACQFRIDFAKARGRTEARLLFVRDGMDIEDPLEAECGGQVDVASLALRLACLLLSKPRRRKLLVMDEPLGNVNGAVYQRRVAALLLALAKDFGVQFIVVSDDDWLKVGRVVDLENPDNR